MFRDWLSRQSSRSLSVFLGLIALWGVVLIPARADDIRDFPARLGRLFRLEPRPAPTPPAAMRDRDANTIVSRPAASGPAAVETPRLPSGSGASARLVPQPRVSKPLTESDPILTRVAVARSDNGSRFGMFLEVFADGTVLDADGVHRVGPEFVRGLSRAITEGELLRRRGHCGAPSTDFIEVYHVTTFERNGRTLRANTFSYTGDPRGCDPSVAKLHAALDKLVMKLSGAAATAGAGLASPPPTSPSLSPNLVPLNGPTDPPSTPQPVPTQSPAAPASDQPPDLLPALPPMSAPTPTTIPLTPLPE